MGIATVIISGLTLSQFAMAISLPQNIQSRIEVYELEAQGNSFSFGDKVFESIKNFDNDPTPASVTDRVFTRDNTGKAKTYMNYKGYADAQSQWGNGVGGTEGGLFMLSSYSATFKKENDNDALHTRISNTGLHVSNFDSPNNHDSSAGFEFKISLMPGKIGPIENSTSHNSLTKVFDEVIVIKGQKGQTLGTLNNPDSGPFTLVHENSLDTGGNTIFTGDYTENGDQVGVFGADYELDTTNIEISLKNFEVGDTFSVVWEGSTVGLDNASEGEVEAHFWDPIKGTGDRAAFFNIGPSTSPIPIPTAVWLFGTGLVGLIGVSSRSHKEKV
jgi:hypothetical protein